MIAWELITMLAEQLPIWLSPVEVLGQETGKLRTPEQLHRIFYAMCFLRRLDRLGYAHFRRWKLYGEEALARHPAVIWLHGDALTVEYEEMPLAQYTVHYQPDKKHFKAVLEAKRFETPYRSLQGWLWELDETLWQLARRLPNWLSLTSLERAAMDWHWQLDENDEFMPYLGISPGGIFAYFEQAGRERVPQAGLDHRLNDRFYRDPPEFFTALHGDTDGFRFGLWYDNPHEPSAFVASYYSRDGGGIAYEGQTLLEAVRTQIEWAEYHLDGYSNKEEVRSEKRLSIWLLRDAVMEYETANRPERGEEYVKTYGKREEKRIPTCNELGVIVPPHYEQPLERDAEAISQAIRTDASQVKTWIDEALQACARGQPALALALGHDLHWLSDDQQERKEAAHLLLTRAYEVLDYRVLAEIATLHHQYRDLPDTANYTFHDDFSAESH